MFHNAMSLIANCHLLKYICSTFLPDIANVAKDFGAKSSFNLSSQVDLKTPVCWEIELVLVEKDQIPPILHSKNSFPPKVKDEVTKSV